MPADVLAIFGGFMRDVAEGRVGEVPGGFVRRPTNRRCRTVARLFAEAIEGFLESGDGDRFADDQACIKFVAAQLKRGSVTVDLLPSEV